MYKYILILSALTSFSLLGMAEKTLSSKEEAAKSSCNQALRQALQQKIAERDAYARSIGGAHNDGTTGPRQLPAYNAQINYFQNRLQICWLYGVLISCRLDSKQESCDFLRQYGAEKERNCDYHLNSDSHSTEAQLCELLRYAFTIGAEHINPFKVKKSSYEGPV